MTGGHPYIFNDASEPIVGPLSPSGVSSANEPATVCVRLDGLADKIAEELERTMFASDRKIPEVIVDLLQSLAVQ